MCKAKQRGLANIDSVAVTNRCFLKCNFAAVCGSFNYCCYHDVLKKKATPGINSLLPWCAESVLPGQALLGLWVNALGASSSVGGGRGWLLGSRAGAEQGEAAKAWGAAGQRGDTHVGLAACMGGSQN